MSTAIIKLLRRLPASRGRIAGTVLLFVASGVLEGSTVGLLVPLLALMTSPGADVQRLVPLAGAWLARRDPHTTMVILGLGILALTALKNLLSICATASSGVLRARAAFELRRQLLERILGAPPATMERYTTGEITDVVVGEAYRVNRVFDACVAIVQRSIIALSYLLMMLILSWQLTVVAMAIGIAVSAMLRQLGRRTLRHGREVSRTSAQLARQVAEVVGGLRVIRTTSSHASFSGAFAVHSRNQTRADTGSSLGQAISQGAIETLGVAGALVLLTVAVTVWRTAGTLDVPRFLAFGFGLVRLLPAISVVYAALGIVTATVGSVERVLGWLDFPGYPTRPFGRARIPALADGIRFENVGLTYSDGHEALRALSFHLPAGETLAILGPSGSGKSTLASIVLRLREPTTGRVLFDGVDHWEFSPEAFHRAVGFVEQEPFLFNLSIAENVACGRPGIDRTAIGRALDLVQLRDLIERLPHGIDTVVAERGATLSGGQRQRLAIARAVVLDPQILVLDEPTSALDPETEAEVIRAMHAASAGRTTLIITHRPATFRFATRRLDLATGRFAATSREPNGQGATV
jgi:ABC-type multidrug transport system fused ATPase/permease subunit